jgi:hypothetical protein
MPDQTLPQCLRGRRRVVTQELDDRRQVLDTRLAPAVLPAVDAAFGDAQPLGNLLLLQLQAKSASPDVVKNPR